MTHDEVKDHIGRTVRVSGAGDLWFNSELRRIISLCEEIPVTLVKLTKGGMAVVQDRSNGQLHAVPPRNVESWRGE